MTITVKNVAKHVVPEDVKVPSPRHRHWHEGTVLIGYWQEGDSYLFRGNNGHVLCVSAGFLRSIRDDG